MKEPESQLLLYCARRTIETPTAERIRALLQDEDIDWTRLVRLALQHEMTALLERGLRETFPDLVPGELLDALRVNVGQSADRAQRFADELLGIVADCHARSVSVIPFKGPTLASLAFGDLRLRSSTDLDLLVREADLPVIGEVLTARGYERSDSPDSPLPDHLEAAYRKYQAEQIYFRPNDEMMVEPQLAIGARTLAYEIDYEALWQHARPFEFNGGEVLGFSLEDLVLILCAHGTKHFWSSLKWIADIAALIESRKDLDLGECLDRARRQGCKRLVLLGLALANRVAGTVLPPPVAEQIASDATCRKLATQTLDDLFREDNDPPGPFTVTAYRILSRERLRDRILHVARCILTPRLIHFSIVRLPPALSFLYYPIKVIHDYVLLPVWLAVKAGRSRKAEPQG